MTSAGQAIAGVMARLDEAREAQVKALADALYDEMAPDWFSEDDAAEEVEASLMDLARRLMAKGYRKAAQ